jgi:hypothetical protein
MEVTESQNISASSEESQPRGERVVFLDTLSRVAQKWRSWSSWVYLVPRRVIFLSIFHLKI